MRLKVDIIVENYCGPGGKKVNHNYPRHLYHRSQSGYSYEICDTL